MIVTLQHSSSYHITLQCVLSQVMSSQQPLISNVLDLVCDLHSPVKANIYYTSFP